MAVRQNVFRGLFEGNGRQLESAAPALGDLPESRQCRSVIRLCEDRVHDRGDGLAGTLRDRGERVAHEVHAAALPCRACEDRPDHLFQTFMCVGNHEAHAPEFTLHHASLKGRPEGAILGRADVHA